MKFNLRKKLQINDLQEYIENRYKNAGVGIRVSRGEKIKRFDGKKDP